MTDKITFKNFILHKKGIAKWSNLLNYEFDKSSNKIVNIIQKDTKKIFIIRKKNSYKLIKVYLNKNNRNLFNREIEGYRFYSKKKTFKIPKLLNYSQNNKISFIEIEYIDGQKVNFFDYNKIFRKNIKLSNNISNKTYINQVSKYYLLVKKKYFIKIKKDIEKFLKKNIFKLNINVSFTHGDLAHYNCLKKNYNYYVFDFEYFRERILIFDHINWFFHPIASNISIYLISNKFNLKSKFFMKIISKLIKYFIYFKLKKILNILNINKNEFSKYYLLYLFEKLYILESGIKSIKLLHNKNHTKKLIVTIKETIYYILFNEKF